MKVNSRINWKELEEISEAMARKEQSGTPLLGTMETVKYHCGCSATGVAPLPDYCGYHADLERDAAWDDDAARR
jgi:hypothetical protein